jgi:geranylgeranyl diphosphate synthase type II
MDLESRIERALHEAIESVSSAGAPPTLAAALRYAVFPGGARVRPNLCLTIAGACGDAAPALADAMAAAVELLHCASLVHDDLPCFDDAPMRRGQPSVHSAFGEPLAVLVGDQLIVLSFQTIARAAAKDGPEKLPSLVEALARGVGMPHGIIAGQAWECERRIPETIYRRAKTASLFEAAAIGGAIAGGTAGSSWRMFGQILGEAYQIADDIQDVTGSAAEIGKPTGRDAVLGRPNAAARLGVHGSSKLFDKLVSDAIDAIPPCANPESVRAWTRRVAAHLVRRPQVAPAALCDAG